VIFNPITGTLIDRLQIANLKRVDLLPFPDENKLRPLLLLRDDSGTKKTELDLYPRQPYSALHPIHLLEFSKTGGTVSGSIVDTGTGVIVENWKTKLGDASLKIVAVAGKSIDGEICERNLVIVAAT
jgi:hypothetical protein